MSQTLDALARMGLSLPPVPAPVASYVPAVISGNTVTTSGQLPLVDGALPVTGKVGAEVDPDTARDLARVCCLNALAAIAAEIDDLDRICRVVKLTGYVSSAPSFTGQPGVINGASDLLGDIFAERGLHARSAVGVAALPLDAPVELDLLVEFR
ncbi:RidA family protein [Devriesea agamarum]|uniref:RidA family protein n=1 Tax=Devriesea agamarum TaxID=472569 RepID=UPI00071D2D8E|nr:RidA family protein [Devriesea agamarum]